MKRVSSQELAIIVHWLTFLQIRMILTYLESERVILPNGGRLSPSRFQQLGLDFGMHGKFFCLISFL